MRIVLRKSIGSLSAGTRVEPHQDLSVSDLSDGEHIFFTRSPIPVVQWYSNERGERAYKILKAENQSLTLQLDDLVILR